MGNIIFDCDNDNIIINKEVRISINENQKRKANEKNIQQLIDSIKKFYINQFFKRLKHYYIESFSNINLTNNQNLLSKNHQESNIPSNMDNLTLNSSGMNKRFIEEDTQILDNNQNNNNLIINPPHSKNETPEGIILIGENSNPPNKEENKPVNKPITKSKKKKKKSPQKSELTPIPEYPTQTVSYDKSLVPGTFIVNFNDIPQRDKITEVENSIGGEFLIDEKDILKCLEEYPYKPKIFSISYPSGEYYSGYFSPDWVKEVFGIQIDKNGNKYVGMFKNGMFEGRGRLILHKGDYYEGDFSQNKANGFGKYVNAKGEIYNGCWIDDKQEGEGELILKDGSIYRGEFKKGKKNGKGKITWNDNSYYEGEFVNNYYQGYGVYIMVNKRKGYLGEWKEGKMHGFGVFFWADGRSYKGYYEADKKHGYGIYSGKNNLRYEGKFRRGKQYGIGRIINENGEKQIGL